MASSSTQTILDLSIDYWDAGLAILPVSPGGSKKPAINKWANLKTQRANKETVQGWFTPNRAGVYTPDEGREYTAIGIGILGGPVSQNLEIGDFEYTEIYEKWLNRLTTEDRAIVDTLPLVRTPGKKIHEKPGGYHLYYRLKDNPGAGQKLALRPIPGEKTTADVLIETRAEGMYAVAPGSHPWCHERKVAYTLVRGDLRNVPIIDSALRMRMLEAARSLDEMPKRSDTAGGAAKDDGSSYKYDNTLVGSDYNTRATSRDILEPHGFVYLKSEKGVEHWQRPNQSNSNRIALTFNYDNSGKFFCFSTSCDPIEAERFSTKLEVYTLLNHDGNYDKALEELEQQGYGKEPPIEWSEPRPIAMQLLPVQPWKPDMMPEVLSRHVQDTAERMPAPPDYIAAADVVWLSSIIGAGCLVRPKQKDTGWMVAANLWGEIIGPPGDLKSACAKAITPCLSLTLDRAKQDARLAKFRFEHEKDQHKADQKGINEKLKALSEKLAKHEIDVDEAQRLKAEMELQAIDLREPSEPVERRYFTNDATVAAAEGLLATNPRGILVFRDELFGFMSGLERHDMQSERAWWMQTWDCTRGPGYHCDRIKRGNTFIANLCISMIGCLTPDKLIEQLGRTATGGDDGLNQRFQVTVYPNPIVWKHVDRAPDVKVQQQLTDIVTKLAFMDFTEYGAKLDGGYPYFGFSALAREVRLEWEKRLMAKVNDENEHPLIKEHLSKYRSLMPKIALIYHCVELAETGKSKGEIGPEATIAAAKFCDYLESHARRIYDIATNIHQKGAALVADRLKKRWIPGKAKNDGPIADDELKFSARDLYRARWWGPLSKVDVAEDVCSYLVDNGWLMERITPTAKGQKEKVEYVVNPRIFESIVSDASAATVEPEIVYPNPSTMKHPSDCLCVDCEL